MNLLDIANDGLDLVISECFEYAMFTSLVCKRFHLAVAACKYPCPIRVVYLSHIFERKDLLCTFLGDRSVMGIIAKRFSFEEKRVIEWSTTARSLGLRYGNAEVVSMMVDSAYHNRVFDENYVSQVVLAGQVRLLESFQGLCCYIPVPSVVEDAITFFSSARYLTSFENSAFSYPQYKPMRVHCAALVYPACKSCSTDALAWLKHTVHQQALVHPTNWDIMFRTLSGVTRSMVDFAATSECAYAMLDQLLALFVENAHGKRMVKYGMIVCLSRFKLRIRSSAWRWLRDACGGKSLQSVIAEFRVASLLGVTHCRLCVPEDEVLMNAAHFEARDVESYEIISDGIQPGGWLYESFVLALGPQTNIDMFTLYYLHRFKMASTQTSCGSALRRGVWLDCKAEELLELCACKILSECENDALNRGDNIAKMGRLLIKTSPYTAYVVCRKSRHISNDDKTLLARMFNKLYTTSLLACARLDMAGVVGDFVSAVEHGCVQLTSPERLAIVRGLIDHRVCSHDTLHALLTRCCINCVTPDDTTWAATTGNAPMFDIMLRVSTSSSRNAIACQLVDNRSTLLNIVGKSITNKIMEICLEQQCFERDPGHEVLAMQLLTQIISDDPDARTRKHRILPPRCNSYKRTRVCL